MISESVVGFLVGQDINLCCSTATVGGRFGNWLISRIENNFQKIGCYLQKWQDRS